jgi:hypothetical protein
MEPHAVYATRLGFRWRKGIASHPGIVALLVSSVATIPLPAPALSWQWSFRRPADAVGSAFFASGMFITTDSPVGSGFYTINSVIGERNSVPISTLLPAGSVAPGNCYAVNNCFASDHLLRALQGGLMLN